MVAVLKPHADFGWHGGYGDMSKAEKKTLIRSHSVVDDDDHSFIGDEETKTVLQIHDAGEGGGGIEMVHFDNPMANTQKPSRRSKLSKDSKLLHVEMTLQSRDADLGVRIRNGGAVAKVRTPNPAQQGGQHPTSRVRVGDTLVLVGDQPVTSATMHVEVRAMLRTAAYPLILTFGRPGKEEDTGKYDDMSRNRSRALLGLSPLPSPLALAAERPVALGSNLPDDS